MRWFSIQPPELRISLDPNPRYWRINTSVEYYEYCYPVRTFVLGPARLEIFKATDDRNFWYYMGSTGTELTYVAPDGLTWVLVQFEDMVQAELINSQYTCDVCGPDMDGLPQKLTSADLTKLNGYVTEVIGD